MTESGTPTFYDLLERNGLEMIGAVAGELRELDTAAEGDVAGEYRRETEAAQTYEKVAAISYRYARQYVPRSFGLAEEPEEEGQARVREILSRLAAGGGETPAPEETPAPAPEEEPETAKR